MARNAFRNPSSRDPKTSGEDAVMVLGLIVTGGFALTIATLLLLELLVALPVALSFVVFVSIVVAVVMLGRAVSEKVASLPNRQRGGVPILRNLVR
jgi:membrane protein implicated in regulation of membrane protease activity